MAIADEPRDIGPALAQGLRRLLRLAGSVLPGPPRLRGGAPERLVMAPPDLHTADPTIAHDIYAGNFCFGLHSVAASGTSPFRLPPPDPRWERELHAFSWLRHLAAAADPLSASNARALLRDWIASSGRPAGGAAWQAEVAADRLIAWLCHSVLVVDGADFAFYRQFLRSIGTHIRFLRGAAARAPAGLARLKVEIALAYASVCVATQSSGPRPVWGNLDAELARQILPDGGHVSRNAAHLPEILALLLPLRQSYARLGIAPSIELVSAIDRMLPAMRFFRLGDGAFARFNGVSATPHDLVATVLRYDDTRGEPSPDASHSGYQRMVLGTTVVVMDTGRPPPGELSGEAHAGCLSFEMSDGRFPLIVNCGAPSVPARDAETAARATAAHSTAAVNDTSSCRFAARGRIAAGPQRVDSERSDEPDATTVTASHDGYLRAFGIVHERTLRLTAGGAVLSGADTLRGEGRGAPRHATRDRVAVRFHVHPAVRCRIWREQRAVLLWTGDGRRWKFTCAEVEPQLEESIFFAAPGGRRRTAQIVLNARAAEHPRLNWRLEVG